MPQKREDESVTAFTSRLLREAGFNEAMEIAVHLCEIKGQCALADQLRRMKKD